MILSTCPTLKAAPKQEPRKTNPFSTAFGIVFGAVSSRLITGFPIQLLYRYSRHCSSTSHSLLRDRFSECPLASKQLNFDDYRLYFAEPRASDETPLDRNNGGQEAAVGLRQHERVPVWTVCAWKCRWYQCSSCFLSPVGFVCEGSKLWSIPM